MKEDKRRAEQRTVKGLKKDGRKDKCRGKNFKRVMSNYFSNESRSENSNNMSNDKCPPLNIEWKEYTISPDTPSHSINFCSILLPSITSHYVPVILSIALHSYAAHGNIVTSVRPNLFQLHPSTFSL